MTLNEEEFISYASDTPSEENTEVPIGFLNTLDVPSLPLLLEKNSNTSPEIPATKHPPTDAPRTQSFVTHD